jgi:hypothetical protein
LRSAVQGSTKASKEPKRNSKEQIKRILLFSIVVIFYVGFLIPYLVHTSLVQAGSVVYSDERALESFPTDIQEILKLGGINKPEVLLVKHIYPEWVVMVISNQNFPVGSSVEVVDIVTTWHVDWHDFNLADGQAFETLNIATVNHMGSLESSVEALYSSQLGSVVYNLSRIDFYAGPVLVVFSLTLLFQRRIALWNLPVVFGLYSVQYWRLNVLASAHHLSVASEWEIFGYFFVVLVPLAIYAWHLERSRGGQHIAQKMRALSEALGLLLE